MNYREELWWQVSHVYSNKMRQELYKRDNEKRNIPMVQLAHIVICYVTQNLT